MYKLIKYVATGFFACLGTTSVHAQESGSAKLSIDGTEYNFTLNAVQSDWSGSPKYASLNINLRAADEATRAMFPGIAIGFEFTGGAPQAVEYRVLRATDAGIERLFGDPMDIDKTISVVELSSEGEELVVSGEINVTVGTSENFGRDVDLGVPISISGGFAVILGPV